MQGIFADSAVFAEICLKKACKFSVFEMNSLRGEQGIILREQGIISAFSSEQGISPNYY
jgi:hypothetical protein